MNKQTTTQASLENEIRQQVQVQPSFLFWNLDKAVKDQLNVATNPPSMRPLWAYVLKRTVINRLGPVARTVITELAKWGNPITFPISEISEYDHIIDTLRDDVVLFEHNWTIK